MAVALQRKSTSGLKSTTKLYIQINCDTVIIQLLVFIDINLIKEKISLWKCQIKMTVFIIIDKVT